MTDLPPGFGFMADDKHNELLQTVASDVLEIMHAHKLDMNGTMSAILLVTAICFYQKSGADQAMTDKNIDLFVTALRTYLRMLAKTKGEST